MNKKIIICEFTELDAIQVRKLFIKVNRLLAPAGLEEDFESYIVLSLREEIDKITEYYQDKNGSFWVALIDANIVGMFGLEELVPGVMELRRMYVDPEQRRKGIGRELLQFAEDQCRVNNIYRLDLSTSEIQSEALLFYRNSGFEYVREDVAEGKNNKTIGGGIRRFYFTKNL